MSDPLAGWRILSFEATGTVLSRRLPSKGCSCCWISVSERHTCQGGAATNEGGFEADTRSVAVCEGDRCLIGCHSCRCRGLRRHQLGRGGRQCVIRQARSASNSNLIISATASPAASKRSLPPHDGRDRHNRPTEAWTCWTIPSPSCPPGQHHLRHRVHDNGLSTPEPGCLAGTPSTVTWNFATSVNGSSHLLTTPLTAGASGTPNNPLAATLPMAPPWGPPLRWLAQSRTSHCRPSRASSPLVGRRPHHDSGH